MISSEVQYDGDYVLTRSGSRDFGELPEIATTAVTIAAGKIRLRIGKHDGSIGNYGEQHIERSDKHDNRLQQLQDNGYANARDLVEDVAQHYNAIYPSKKQKAALGKTQ